jgi:hypothetical protein
LISVPASKNERYQLGPRQQLWLAAGKKPESAGVFRPEPGRPVIVVVEGDFVRYEAIAVSVSVHPPEPQVRRPRLFLWALSRGHVMVNSRSLVVRERTDCPI